VLKEIKAATVAEEFSGETFRNDVGSFVNSEIEELLWYRDLVHARNKWAVWAKRISRGVFLLMLLEGAFTVAFFTMKVIDRSPQAYVLLSSVAVTAIVTGFCIVCAGVMIHHYEKISEYRDKVL
jgi:hypothetical protein